MLGAYMSEEVFKYIPLSMDRFSFDHDICEARMDKDECIHICTIEDYYLRSESDFQTLNRTAVSKVKTYFIHFLIIYSRSIRSDKKPQMQVWRKVGRAYTKTWIIFIATINFLVMIFTKLRHIVLIGLLD